MLNMYSDSQNRLIKTNTHHKIGRMPVTDTKSGFSWCILSAAFLSESIDKLTHQLKMYLTNVHKLFNVKSGVYQSNYVTFEFEISYKVIDHYFTAFSIE